MAEDVLLFLQKCYNIDVYEAIIIIKHRPSSHSSNKLFKMLDLNDPYFVGYALLKLANKALELDYR